jgi:WD40 repeat protein
MTIKLWGAASGRELLTLKGHTHPVTSIGFSPDGQRLASTGNDQTVKVWDVAAGQELLAFKGHTHDINSVVYSRDGQRLISASEYGTRTHNKSRCR